MISSEVQHCPNSAGTSGMNSEFLPNPGRKAGLSHFHISKSLAKGYLKDT